MNSIDYAKVLKHLLKTHNCNYFIFMPLQYKDRYDPTYRISVSVNAVNIDNASLNKPDIWCMSCNDHALYCKMPSLAIINEFFHWPCENRWFDAHNIDEQSLCKAICDVLFSTAKKHGDVKIGFFANYVDMLVFLERNTTIEQVVIDMELASENA